MIRNHCNEKLNDIACQTEADECKEISCCTNGERTISTVIKKEKWDLTCNLECVLNRSTIKIKCEGISSAKFWLHYILDKSIILYLFMYEIRIL